MKTLKGEKDAMLGFSDVNRSRKRTDLGPLPFTDAFDSAVTDRHLIIDAEALAGLKIRSGLARFGKVKMLDRC